MTWLGYAQTSMPFLHLLLFTVLALLLVPLQLRFRLLWLVLAAVYLHAVFVSLNAGRRRTWLGLRWLFVSAWIVALALRVAPVTDPHLATLFHVTSRMLMVALLGGCLVSALDYVLRGREVSADRIFAAIVAYMLAGLAFAAVYVAVHAVAPDSFALSPVTGGNEHEQIEVQLIYYSFVTIATLGYGDITPRLPLAQMLSVLEAVFGQFYVAVVIAWLVSRYAARGPAP
ncbi:MAG TPA: potassium channel family protein [Methylomirabilota bacterium]|nr:potassium channel family protein [Methylomirabilota bacterium]